MAPEGDKGTVFLFVSHTVVNRTFECYQVFIGPLSQVYWHSETPVIVELMLTITLAGATLVLLKGKTLDYRRGTKVPRPLTRAYLASLLN